MKSLQSFKHNSGFKKDKSTLTGSAAAQHRLSVYLHTCKSINKRVITGQTRDLRLVRFCPLLRRQREILTLLQKRTQPWMAADFHSCKDRKKTMVVLERKALATSLVQEQVNVFHREGAQVQTQSDESISQRRRKNNRRQARRTDLAIVIHSIWFLNETNLRG